MPTKHIRLVSPTPSPLTFYAPALRRVTRWRAFPMNSQKSPMIPYWQGRIAVEKRVWVGTSILPLAVPLLQLLEVSNVITWLHVN